MTKEPEFRRAMLSPDFLSVMGVTLQDFAAECHCSEAVLRRYRDNKSQPGGKILVYMAAAYCARGVVTSEKHLMGGPTVAAQ